MIDNHIPQTAAAPGSVAPFATMPAGDLARADNAPATDGRAGIDPRRVTQLAMYLREALYLVRLDGDDALRAVSLDAWCALRRAVSSDPARRLVPVPGGRDDVIWRVERLDAPAGQAQP